MNDLLTDSFELSKNGSSRGLRHPKNRPDYGMEVFFEEHSETFEDDRVRKIEQLMDKLSKNLSKLQEANEESKSVTKASAMKGIKQRMEKDIDEVGKIAREIKSKLEEMDKDNLINRQNPGCEKGTGIDRSRMSMTVALKKKLKERMHDFQNLRQSIQDEYREVAERRIFTVTGAQPSDEVIDRLIETGNSEQIFEKAMQEMGRGQVIDTLEEIQERHDAVKEIEKKLLGLHQVFMDMAVLVEAQGEILDNIESQVSNAANHVQSGNDALRTAKSLQKRSRKCTMIAIIIFLLIVAVTVLFILKPWNK